MRKMVEASGTEPSPAPASRGSRWGSARALVAVLLGVLLGLGLATFDYAEGTSYLSTDPRACANCHIMERQFDSWQKASHHTVATCVDCHLPRGLFEKYEAKLVNGYNHSRAFTFQDFAEPIQMTPRNRQILEASCRVCHGELVHGIAPAGADARDQLSCIHCHRSVGHGEHLGLGGPDRGEPGERE